MTPVTSAKPESQQDTVAVNKARFFSILEETYSGTERLASLKKMYDEYGDRLWEAPASGKVHFHNAFAGGYIEHVLHVYDTAIEITKVLNRRGGSVDYNRSELTMATLHHDLWKLGIPNGQPYYLVETSDWHRKNQGSMFKHNELLPFFKVTDGALYLLQSFGIPLTYNETMGIKLSDGLYEDSNKGYLMHFGKFPIHTNLGYIIHWADHLSTVAERDPLKLEFLSGGND